MSTPYRPQSDGQNKVINHSLGDILLCLVGDNIKTWDQWRVKLSSPSTPPSIAIHDFFSFESLCFGSLGSGWLRCGFEVNSRSWTSSGFVGLLSHIHSQVNDALHTLFTKYKAAAYRNLRDAQFKVQFKVGDMVWEVLAKEHFASGDYNKLKARKIGPPEVLERMIANPYYVCLPAHICCSDIFNRKDLFSYISIDDNENSRANIFLPRITWCSVVTSLFFSLALFSFFF